MVQNVTRWWGSGSLLKLWRKCVPRGCRSREYLPWQLPQGSHELVQVLTKKRRPTTDVRTSKHDLPVSTLKCLATGAVRICLHYYFPFKIMLAYYNVLLLPFCGFATAVTELKNRAASKGPERVTYRSMPLFVTFIFLPTWSCNFCNSLMRMHLMSDQIIPSRSLSFFSHNAQLT